MESKPSKCVYCGLTPCLFQWRMADQYEDRIPGYQPNPEGRGVHFLCEDCSRSNNLLQTTLKG